VRKVLERAQADLRADFHGRPLGDAILEPTRIYVRPVLKLLEAVPVKGMAHITGGGITGNVPRMLPQATRAVVKAQSWPRPALFKWLQERGEVAEDEMYRVFNCGIGLVLCVSEADAGRAAALLRAEGETVFEIGRIEAHPGEQPDCVVV
jgi:phosphoribosylformylglycinamidine cyclo-ligase